jgi:hypothetical protein
MQHVITDYWLWYATQQDCCSSGGSCSEKGWRKWCFKWNGDLTSAIDFFCSYSFQQPVDSSSTQHKLLELQEDDGMCRIALITAWERESRGPPLTQWWIQILSSVMVSVKAWICKAAMPWGTTLELWLHCKWWLHCSPHYATHDTVATWAYGSQGVYMHDDMLHPCLHSLGSILWRKQNL